MLAELERPAGDELLEQRRTELPRVTADILAVYPDLARPLGEFAVWDPVTFLHAQMGAMAYDLVARDLCSQVNVPLAGRCWLVHGKVGMALHDIGKLAILPSVEASIGTVNRTDGNGNGRAMIAGEDHVDTRRDWEVAMHKLHPLVGGYMVLELARHCPNTDPDLFPVWAEIPFTHHENLAARGKDDGKDNSYPRGRCRNHGGWRDLTLLLAQTSDYLVAMGQPRVYREYRLDDLTILNLISREMLSEAKIARVFSHLSETEIVRMRILLTAAAMRALTKVQHRYSKEDCLRPGSFSVKGKPFRDSGNPGGSLIQHLSEQVWKEHGRRFDKTASESLKSR